MRTTLSGRALLWAAPLVAALLCWWLSVPPSGARPTPPDLPRFTEEREAAALFFVKKHLPEFLPVLEKLKKSNVEEYQREIREIFQVTELLADLRDDMQRYELELKIWVAENRAHLLIARLSTPNEEDRKKIQGQLQEIAGQLVALDLEVLDHKAELLDRELGEVKDEARRIRDNRDKHTKERFDALLQKVKKRKM
jgi:hypothetical protein